MEQMNQPKLSTPARSGECYLAFTKRVAETFLSYLQNHHRELGEIMDVMCADSEQIGEEDFPWMLARLALTRRTIDEILDAAKHQLHLPAHHFFNYPENQ